MVCVLFCGMHWGTERRAPQFQAPLCSPGRQAVMPMCTVDARLGSRAGDSLTWLQPFSLVDRAVAP